VSWHKRSEKRGGEMKKGMLSIGAIVLSVIAIVTSGVAIVLSGDDKTEYATRAELESVHDGRIAAEETIRGYVEIEIEANEKWRNQYEDRLSALEAKGSITTTK
jgi:hypothetical protein